MAADSAGQSLVDALTKKLLASSLIGRRGVPLLVIASYVLGTHHQQTLSRLLRIVIALGADVSS